MMKAKENTIMAKNVTTNCIAKLRGERSRAVRVAFALVLAFSLALPSTSIAFGTSGDNSGVQTAATSEPESGSAAASETPADDAVIDESTPEQPELSEQPEQPEQPNTGTDPDVVAPDTDVSGDGSADTDASLDESVPADGPDAEAADPLAPGATATDAAATAAADDVAQIIRTSSGTETFVAFYTKLEDAFAAAQPGDRIEMIRNATLDSAITLRFASAAETLTLTTAPPDATVAGASGWLGGGFIAGAGKYAARVTRTDGAASIGVKGGTLALSFIYIDGGSASKPAVQGSAPLLTAEGTNSTLSINEYAQVVNAASYPVTDRSGSGKRYLEVIGITNARFTMQGTQSALKNLAVEDPLGEAHDADGSFGTAPVTVRGASEVILTANIEKCTSVSRGGAFAVEGVSDDVKAKFSINGGSMFGNTSATDGGAVAVKFTDMVVSGNPSFSKNTSKSSPTGGGGAIYANHATVEILGGFWSDNKVEEKGEGNAIFASDSDLRFKGGEVKSNSGAASSAVYMGTDNGSVYLSGYTKISDNGTASNLQLQHSNQLVVDGPLEYSGVAFITIGAAMPNAGDPVGTYLSDTSDNPYSANLRNIKSDKTTSMWAVDGGKGKIVWSAAPVCQIIRPVSGVDTFVSTYGTFVEAANAAQSGDRIEMLVDGELPVKVGLDKKALTITTAPVVQPVPDASVWLGKTPDSGDPQAVITRTGKYGQVLSGSSGSLTLSNIVFDGGSNSGIVGKEPLFEMGGAFTLDVGAVVQNAASGLGGWYETDTYYRSVIYMNSFSSVFTMKSGSRISNLTIPNSSNWVSDDATRDKGSAPITLFGGRANINGGVIENCSTASASAGVLGAYRNGVVVTIDGDAVIRGNHSEKGPGVLDLTLNTASHTLMIGGSARIEGNSSDSGKAGVIVLQVGSFTIQDDAAIVNNVGIKNGPTTSVEAANVISCASTAKLNLRGGSIMGNNGAANYAVYAPVVNVSGDPVVAGNTGGNLYRSTLSNYTFLKVDGPLSPDANIGIYSDYQETNRPGARFGWFSLDGDVENLDIFVNDKFSSMYGVQGAGSQIVWNTVITDVSFTKMGSDQITGLSVGLPGAKFKVYEYQDNYFRPIGTDYVEEGLIPLPTQSGATVWRPLINAEGTVGEYANSPAYRFVSGADGKVTIKNIRANEWYMLVEESAPQGYFTPLGQWAFRATDPDGDGVYEIDTKQVIGFRAVLNNSGTIQWDKDGQLPPAMATSVETAGGTETGVFVINMPTYSLPNAGVPVQLPVALIAGSSLVMLALVVRRVRLKSSWHRG